MILTPERKAYFWSHVSKGNGKGCWLWRLTALSFQYTNFNVAPGKPVAAHRLSYMLAKGELPKGAIVLHECDHPACVNPAHLTAGTHQDNRRDFFSKNPGKRVCDPSARSNEARRRLIAHVAYHPEWSVRMPHVLKVMRDTSALASKIKALPRTKRTERIIKRLEHRSERLLQTVYSMME